MTESTVQLLKPEGTVLEILLQILNKAEGK